MKNLFNIISTFAYYISIMIYIIIIIILASTNKPSVKLNPTQYESESGFNYLEDTDVFD